MYCSFDSQTVQATVESRERIVCNVPPAYDNLAKYATVRVSVNGQEYSQNAGSFLYFKVSYACLALDKRFFYCCYVSMDRLLFIC